ncbi:MAG TPA: SDR family oxidoreductase [Pirellulales bacterium]|nr:SDR family oxidoreductase [Pirellulales bacterium]
MQREATNRRLVIALSTAGGAAAAALLIAKRRRNRAYWRNKVVMISGGSRGLGLEMARVWIARGARVAICSRDQREVDQALADLAATTDQVFGQVCDVTAPKQVNEFIGEILQRWGRIDCLVNNAGIITVGPLDCMTKSDFRSAMDTHFWAPLHAVQTALPHLQSTRGHIVNIASVGGEVSVPHLLPYSASKSALVGLSEGLRAELIGKGIRVTTVCPGLMRTGSPRNAHFKGQNQAEYAWFSISGSLPGLSMPSRWAARRIVNATTDGRAYLALSLPAKLAIGAHGLFPGLVSRLMGWANRLLPASDGAGRKTIPGFESESRWSPSVLTRLNERAALRNNEIRGQITS